MAQWIIYCPDDRFGIWHRRERTSALGQYERHTGGPPSCMRPVRFRTPFLNSVATCVVRNSQAGVDQHVDAQHKVLVSECGLQDAPVTGGNEEVVFPKQGMNGSGVWQGGVRSDSEQRGLERRAQMRVIRDEAL